ncbi:MAG: hypothetical protein KGI97_08300 [Alphaproteobacteria bacterium]|nr:hypothetical protein [Alphaproteobacteria bacterium]
MPFLTNLFGQPRAMNAALAAHPAPHPDKRPLLHPEKAPATMHVFPIDFAAYTFGGAVIATLRGRNAAGEPIRRRTLVARMILKETTPDGASVEIEMSASLRDLEKGCHPQAAGIRYALVELYASKAFDAEPSMDKAVAMDDSIAYAQAFA